MWSVSVRDLPCYTSTVLVTLFVGVVTLVGVLVRREYLKVVGSWPTVIFGVVLTPCISYAIMYLVWYNSSACAVLWAKKAFCDGYQEAFDPPPCFINRSETNHLLKETVSDDVYYLLEGPHGSGKTAALKNVVNSIGSGAMYTIVSPHMKFDESFSSTLSLEYICKPNILQHLAIKLGVGTDCPKTPLRRIENILSIVETAARDMKEEGISPILVIDNAGELVHKEQGEDILRVLQSFAKFAADMKILRVVFASSDGTVPGMFSQRSVSSRLVTLFMEDITYDDAIEYLQCRVPQASIETINATVNLVGDRLSDLVKTAQKLQSGHGISTIQAEFFGDVEEELKRAINTMQFHTHDLGVLTLQIAKAILDSNDKQITSKKLQELLLPFNEKEDALETLLSSNIFMRRKLYTKFQSVCVESYFKSIIEDQTEE